MDNSNIDVSSKNTEISELISAGAELVGASVGGAAGFILSGPLGAATGGAGGVVVAKTLNKIGHEISQRLIGPREKIRVGGVLTLAAEEIKERISKGEKIRSDNFFDYPSSGRSDADEVIENVLLKSQREPQEKKLPFLAHLYVNIAFSQEISTAMAHQLIKGVEQLTYRELCILRLCAIRETFQLRDSDYRKLTSFPKELYQILYECFDLYLKGYVNNGESVALGISDIIPAKMTPQGLGADIHNFLQLWNIPLTDIQPIVDQLKQ